MITVISKHLHLINNGLVSRDQVLRNIHYIEMIRYKFSHLENLRKSEINVPNDFSPGISIPETEISHLYRFMAIWFEIESIVLTGRSFLDYFWRTVAGHCLELQSIKEIKNQKYIASAMRELRKEKYSENKSTPYKLLEKEWVGWGKYLMDFRKYIEYTEPLGGILSQSIGKLVQSGNVIDIELPDEFPGFNDKPESYKFKYTKNITANSFLSNVVSRIDVMMPLIVNEMHESILKSIENK